MGYSTKYVEFGGTDEYVTAGNVLGFGTNQPFSVSFWFRTTATATAYTVSKTAATIPGGWQIMVAADGKIHMEFIYSYPTSWMNSYTDVGWNDGLWHHAVVTWDGNATPGEGGLKIYVDGAYAKLGSSANSLGTNSITNSGSFNIGRREMTPSEKYFVGGLDEVAVYSKELSAVEAAWIYNGGVARDLLDVGAPSNLSAWWRMGESDTFPTLQDSVSKWGNPYPTIADASGNGHTGTMSGSAGQITTDTPGGTSTHSVTCDGLSTSIGFGGSTTCSFDSDEAFSFSLWIKTSSFNATSILRKVDSGVGYYLGINANNLQWYLHDNAGHDANIVFQGLSVSTGAWVHVVCTYDGAGNIKTYRNGVSDGSASGTLTGSLVNPGWFGIGLGTYYTGKIDDVAVYTKEITLAEAQWIYNSGAPRRLDDAGAPPNLYAWWRMGDDGSDIRYSGTMSNMEAGDIQDRITAVDADAALLGDASLTALGLLRKPRVVVPRTPLSLVGEPRLPGLQPGREPPVIVPHIVVDPNPRRR